MNDYFYTINGKRYVVINDTVLSDHISLKYLLQGFRKTEAYQFLTYLGCSEEIAEEYLQNLPERSRVE